MPLLREDELLKKYNKHKASTKKKDKAPVIVPEREAVEKDYKPELTDFVKYKSSKKGVRVEMPDRVQIIKAGFAKGFMVKISKLKESAIVVPSRKSCKPAGRTNKKSESKRARRQRKKKESWHFSWPNGKPARFKGVSVKQDKDGYFCYTHRCRSKSYPTPEKIPDSKIKFIESTG